MYFKPVCKTGTHRPVIYILVMTLYFIPKNRSINLAAPDVSSTASTNPREVATPSPQMGHAHSLLLKLVSESDSKSVAFTEEVSDQ